MSAPHLRARRHGFSQLHVAQIGVLPASAPGQADTLCNLSVQLVTLRRPRVALADHQLAGAHECAVGGEAMLVGVPYSTEPVLLNGEQALNYVRIRQMVNPELGYSRDKPDEPWGGLAQVKRLDQAGGVIG